MVHDFLYFGFLSPHQHLLLLLFVPTRNRHWRISVGSWRVSRRLSLL
jgi:hypothetical protein